MEADASGLPVVATDIRGCRQVVENGTTCLLAPTRKPAELAGAIRALVTDPDLRRTMSVAAGELAHHFDQRQVIDITLGSYRR